MAHYKVKERELFFVLKEQLRYGQLCEYDRYRDLSENEFDMVIKEAIKFAHRVIAPLSEIGEEVGVSYQTGKVLCPPAYRDAFRQYGENGWIAAARDTTYGGQGLPLMMRIIINELFYGAYQSFNILPSVTHGSGHLIESFGSQELKDIYVGRMYAGQWSGTMCLTEPQAGSNLANVKTKAVREGNNFKISGNKMFITYGDHDVTENIVHLILARIEGAPEGVAGISLFVVPKIRVDAAGRLIGPNDVTCGGIEKKMGLHGAPTTVMNFGENSNCIGYLCGQENSGLLHMFQMMNQARINSGVSGMTLASSAYLNALEYTKERLQGADIAGRKKGSVPIIDHPDVRRMLLWMKGMVEGLRSLIYLGAFYSDLAHSETDSEKRARYELLLEFLTPIIKAYSSHKGFEVCSTAMQCFGGYGYTKDYPIEMYLRDVRAPALYEGTNGIQSIDLLKRKTRMNGGAAYQAFIAEVESFVSRNANHPRFSTEIRLLDKTLCQLHVVISDNSKQWKTDPLRAASQTFPLLLCLGDVALVWRSLDMAVIAYDALSRGTSEKEFYGGKVMASTYLSRETLPQTLAVLNSRMVERPEIIEMADDQF